VQNINLVLDQLIRRVYREANTHANALANWGRSLDQEMGVTILDFALSFLSLSLLDDALAVTFYR